MATSDPLKSNPWPPPQDNTGDNRWQRRRSSRELAREELLRDWYGEDLAAREIEAAQRREKHVDAVVDGLLRSWHQEDRIILRELIDRWQEVVGVNFARHCQPASLERGCLQIEVFNSVIRFKLQGVQLELTRKVQELVGDAVKSIQFITGGHSPSRPS